MIFDIPVRLSGKISVPPFKRRRFVIRARVHGIECSNCNASGSIVIDSREIGTGKKRRRECKSCGHRFTTLESVVRDI